LGTLANSSYNTGGVAHIIGRKIFVYFNGDICDFERQLKAAVCKLVVETAINGSGFMSNVEVASTDNESDWFIDGLASYCSENWTTDIDASFKELFQSKNLKKIKHVQSEYATLTGHSIWKFIADTYGESAINDCVRSTKRRNSNEYTCFETVLNLSYKNLEKAWRKYYTEMYATEPSAQKPENVVLSNKKRKHISFDNVKYSCDGSLFTYTTTENGLKKLYVKNVANGTIQRIYKVGYRSNNLADNTFPIVAWHPSKPILAIASEEQGGTKLFFYDMNGDNKKNYLFLQNHQFSSLGFQKVLDMTYSPNGSHIVFSATKGGHSDLFLWNIVSGVATPLTDDIYNDYNPTFINDKGDIAFASNRNSNNENSNNAKTNINPNHDIFVMNVLDPSSIRQMTKTANANETDPKKVRDNRFLYLSDKNGINNLYVGDFDSIIYFVDTTTHYNYFLKTKALTDKTTNIQDYDVFNDKVLSVSQSNYISYVEEQNIPNLLSEELDDFSTGTAGKTSYRKQQIYADSIKMLVPTRKARHRFFNVDKKDTNPDLPTQYASSPHDEDTDISEEANLSKQLHTEAEEELPDKWKYYNLHFYINQLITQVDFSSMNYSYQQFSGGSSPIYLYSGLNVLVGTGLTDLMEDYTMSAGVNISTDLVNNEYALTFSNLKHRLDREIIFHRFTDVSTNYYYTQTLKNRTHEFMYKLTWPFNDYLYISGTATVRNDKQIYTNVENIASIAEPVTNSNWVGAKGELVFDNSYSIAQNLLLGTRFKVFGEFYQKVAKENHNLMVFGFDFRNYQRIHRQMIFAWRIAGSTSLGTDRLIYYMGGVDNWIIPRYNYDNELNTDINYAYQTLATNMRGFSQNTRNGPNFIVLNAELRFPVFRYLFNRPIKSKFLNSIQLVGFTDIGTAWNGLTPYSEENSFYKDTYSEPPMYIEVITQKEPFILGFGAGARAAILGYFLRVDYGWGVEDWAVSDQGWHFSIGLDF
ncbi:MAG: hypothetical protein PHR20_08740, partial [Bacteroidales bacterium]|nr:hypothetical protein [Bacteroidales bacterium]